MTNDVEIFADQQSNEEVELPEVLQMVQNEDGTPKYDSVEEGFKALASAQEHIKTLEAENSTFRDDLSKRQTTEELLQEIKSQPNSGQDPSSNIDLADVAELVDRQLSARESAQSVQSNQKSVVAKMQEVFGPKAEELFIEKANDLGLGVQTFQELAGKSPKAVLSYFDLKMDGAPSAPTSSGSVNTETIIPDAEKPSAKVPYGASTKQLNDAWAAAGKLVDIEGT